MPLGDGLNFNHEVEGIFTVVLVARFCPTAGPDRSEKKTLPETETESNMSL